MCKLLLGLAFVLFCLTGCNIEQKDLGQITEDILERTSREIHNYTYDENGNILLDNEVIYDIVNQRVVDTTRTTSRYMYENNNLIKIDIQSEISELSLTKSYKYDAKDSLTLELWIELNGDTTFFNKFVYDINGNTLIEETRKLFDKRTTEEIINNPTKIVYDTIYIKLVNEFNGRDCILSKVINKKGEVESEIVFTYENGRKVKAETYKFLGTVKYVYSTQTYDYTYYPNGEYETIDVKGFPIESLSVEMRKGKLYKRTLMIGDYMLIQFFDNSGKIIKDADFSAKRVTDYTYDKKGNRTAAFTFPMPDTDLSRGYNSLKSLLDAAKY
jgi:hypothetical protein